MTKKNKIALSGSVQSKNGHLYLVYAHFDPMRKEKKPKWKSMGLDVGEKKSVIEKRKRERLVFPRDRGDCADDVPRCVRDSQKQGGL